MSKETKVQATLKLNAIGRKLGFPNKKVSLLISNNEQEALNNEINNNDISFIFPHQLSLINKKLFDLIVAIDCLHEMDRKTLNLYFIKYALVII